MYAEAKIQELAERKMRSDKPELARAVATALENRKPFDLRWQQGGSWKPLTAKSAKRLETIPVGAPVMPVGDGLGGLIADSDAFQLRQWQP